MGDPLNARAEAAAVAQRLCGLLCRRDVDGFVSLLASDCVVTVEGFLPGGVEGTRQWLESVCAAFPDIYAQVIDGSKDRDGGSFSVALGGRHREPLASPFGTVPATGRSVKLDETVRLAVADGVVTELELTLDRVSFVFQLGLMSPPTRPGRAGG